ncbi:hypothetical protein [Cognatishimia sp. F0-27]|uniref:hypothetical protein n=1 Tax=Cognatishimia sp. F0-27 TaxID=2816855 RepID=UPI001D0C4D8D|nr:hypothetical protein [Cognatishimia sp. F0-27]MCC1494657.1 hypothetical protein [Cognatishimia sp. F0-27]
MTRTILIMGSAPDVIACRAIGRSQLDAIVAINNAWSVRDDWDYHIAPDDFPAERGPGPLRPGQVAIGSETYVPANNRFGGIVYAGGTMAFTAGYWALDALRPSAMIFAGCNMVYPPSGRTHFYGSGTADPLRQDVTLRNLEAKSARLMAHAARRGCACYRLPSAKSRTLFPPIRIEQVGVHHTAPLAVDEDRFAAVIEAEKRAQYFVESGRYWDEQDQFSTEQIDRIDALWLQAVQTHPPVTASQEV